MAQHNVRPRESHFMRAVTALRELDMHTGANYVHTKPEEDAAETWREEDGAYYYNPARTRCAPPLTNRGLPLAELRRRSSRHRAP